MPSKSRSTAHVPAGRRAGEPADTFVHALLTASRALVAVSVRSLDELEDSITLPQFRTLVVLDTHKEMNLNRLAEILEVNASSAVRMIDRLLAAGLVTRRENPSNRRQVLLGLTPDGSSAVSGVTAARRRAIGRIVAAMPAQVREDLVDALWAFSSAAGERAPESELDQMGALGW